MRGMKRSTRGLLIVCVCILAIIVYTKYMFAIERNYPAIRQTYGICREKTEAIYALMLPYVETNGLDLDWYGIHSNMTPWQEDAFVLLKELEDAYIALNGSITSNAIDFYKTSTGYWCMSIHVVTGYGRQVYLEYSPYDGLPRSYSQRLEDLAYGWSFAALLNY